jgi:hypothetical protein
VLLFLHRCNTVTGSMILTLRGRAADINGGKPAQMRVARGSNSGGALLGATTSYKAPGVYWSTTCGVQPVYSLSGAIDCASGCCQDTYFGPK